MKQEERTLPEGWVETTLDNIGKIYSGGTPKTSESKNFDGEIPWITPADLTGYTATYISSGRRNLTQKGLENSSAKLMPEGTVLFSSRAPIGYVAIASTSMATNQGFKSVKPADGIESEYVYYHLKASKQLAENNASGTTFKELSGSRFAKLPIPIAPLNEQRRIVDKIETLFSDLDKGEEHLRATQKLLKRYRQSVLKAAVTGELTRDWREENRHRLESGEHLLQRILKTRREQWQGRGKYKEPAAPDASNLSEIPEGWVWCSPDQLSSHKSNSLCIGPFGSNLKVSDYKSEGVPLIFVRHIRAKQFDGLNEQFVSHEKAEELSSHHVKAGDLLITKMGDPPGDVCIYPYGRSLAIITADCIRFSPSMVDLSHEYLELALSSRVAQQQIHAITKGVAQQKVTLANFKRIGLPLPPAEEQAEIADHVTDIFSQIDALEAWCATELKRSGTLRQSVLKSAFSGQLVPQDPADEPASELLKRIQAERAASPQKRKKA